MVGGTLGGACTRPQILAGGLHVQGFALLGVATGLPGSSPVLCWPGSQWPGPPHPAPKRFRARQRCRGMLTSITRGGGYRLLSLLRRGHGRPPGAAPHLRRTFTPNRGWSWLRTAGSLTSVLALVRHAFRQ